MASVVYYTILDFYDTIKQNDLDKHMSYYDEGSWNNLSKIRANEEALWANSSVELIRVNDLNMSIHEDFANVTYFIEYLRKAENRTINLSGSYFMRLRRQDSGNWRIVEMHQIKEEANTNFNVSHNKTIEITPTEENNSTSHKTVGVEEDSENVDEKNDKANTSTNKEICPLTSMLISVGLGFLIKSHFFL